MEEVITIKNLRRKCHKETLETNEEKGKLIGTPFSQYDKKIQENVLTEELFIFSKKEELTISEKKNFNVLRNILWMLAGIGVGFILFQFKIAIIITGVLFLSVGIIYMALLEDPIPDILFHKEYCEYEGKKIYWKDLIGMALYERIYEGGESEYFVLELRRLNAIKEQFILENTNFDLEKFMMYCRVYLEYDESNNHKTLKKKKPKQKIFV